MIPPLASDLGREPLRLGKLSFHLGADYACVMGERQTTDAAVARIYGQSRNVEAYGKLFAESPDLLTALLRANDIINWMASYLGRMAPPSNGISDLNDHWLYMQKIGRALPSEGTDARHGRPLDQRVRR